MLRNRTPRPICYEQTMVNNTISSSNITSLSKQDIIFNLSVKSYNQNKEQTCKNIEL